MNPIVSQIVALNSYARKGGPLRESWATTQFQKTYAAAVGACKDKLDFYMGVDISWEPRTPQVLYVRQTGLISERIEFSRDLPVEGELARVFLTDLQALAVLEAAEHIKAERAQALLEEAGCRVARVLSEAAIRKVTATA